MLKLDQISRIYDDVPALSGVSLEIPPGRVTAILGPSGCGKSTLLRLIAGLEQPDSGRITWDGADLAGTPTHARRFGLMFQDFALFPHLDVAANIAFGLRYTDLAPGDAAAQVAELLDLVGLAGFGDRAIDTLSGGERQRVALARSLAPRPQLLMLDEPLGALDRALRDRLLDDLREILARLALTTLYVTHDQAEAFAVADRIVLMRRGGIEQVGTPQALYREPASVFAAHFFGLDNIVPGKVEGGRRLITALGELVLDPKADHTGDGGKGATAAGTASEPAQSAASEAPRSPALDRTGSGRAVEVLIRPEVETGDPSGAFLKVRGTVRSVRFGGAVSRVTLDTTAGPLRFEFPAGAEIAGVGTEMVVPVPEDHIRIYS